MKGIGRPRIGIDMHVVDGIFQGSRTHCLELFSRVVALTPECDFILLSANPDILRSFSANFLLPHVSLIRMPEQPAPVRLLWQLPRIVRRHAVSLLHTQYIAPPIPLCPTAVTIHDILFESHREFFNRSMVLRSRVLVRASARQSAEIFTVSEFSFRQICDTYNISKVKVHTIPNGVDRSRFFPGSVGLQSVQARGLKSRGYFLTVGRLEPRKNHVALLRAWSQLEAPRPRLVIVGQRHFRYGEIFQTLRDLRLDGEVLILDEVPDVELPAIYRHARGFIYSSWAEGFGMPLLEAMASGIPVVSSTNTALTEVCAGAALGIDPANPSEIANAVRKLDSNQELWKNLSDLGLERAKEFTWENSARTVRDVYLRRFGL